jgi:hypothetical protein
MYSGQKPVSKASGQFYSGGLSEDDNQTIRSWKEEVTQRLDRDLENWMLRGGPSTQRIGPSTVQLQELLSNGIEESKDCFL